MHNNFKICRVCGFEYKEFYPWGEDGRTASFEICDCCGVTFGNEDSQYQSVIKYREKWIKEGANWFEESMMPEKWNLEESLNKIPNKYK